MIFLAVSINGASFLRCPDNKGPTALGSISGAPNP